MGIGTPVALLVGIILILMGIGLFFLDNFKPGYKRDSDTVYSVLLLTVGILSLLIWNANFAESLQLMVAAGTITALMIERIQSRSANNDLMRQSGGRGPSRREVDRPSRSYRSGYDDGRSDLRVELDDELMQPLDDPSWSRRIPGAREERSSARSGYSQTAYLDQLAEESRSSRRPSPAANRSGYEDERAYGEERSRRSSLQLQGDVEVNAGAYDAGNGSSTSNRRRRTSNRRPVGDELSMDVPPVEEAARSSNRRRRPRSESRSVDSQDGDYVDYKPINPNYPDVEMDNSANFDDDPDFK